MAVHVHGIESLVVVVAKSLIWCFMPEIFTAYAITLGWAVTGSVGMAIGIVLALKIFDLSTPKVDEWQKISEGNMAVAVVISSFIVSVALVIAAAVR